MNPHPLFSQLEKHLKELISFPSVTPEDRGCQDYIQSVLEPLGFHCQRYPKNKTSNLYAEIGTQGPLFVFAGHTDVVEPGPEDQWYSPPFQLTEKEGHWYGRGMADMKGGIAAMLVALENTLPIKSRLGILLTSAEEGSDYEDGTPYVMKKLYEQGKKIDYCMIGEPSSEFRSGDSIKIGRRGSLSATAIIHGRQGHVAYPDLAKNAIHLALPFLHELSNIVLDEGNEHFPPSTLQITGVHHFTTAKNIIPGTLEIHFNIRFNPLQTSEKLKKCFEDMAKKNKLDIQWSWELSGNPFYTNSEFLINLCQLSVEKHLERFAKLSTSGGTSDGRFIAPYGTPVVELGLPYTSIHQINENVKIEDVILLTEIYTDIIKNI